MRRGWGLTPPPPVPEAPHKLKLYKPIPELYCKTLCSLVNKQSNGEIKTDFCNRCWNNQNGFLDRGVCWTGRYWDNSDWTPSALESLFTAEHFRISLHIQVTISTKAFRLTILTLMFILLRELKKNVVLSNLEAHLSTDNRMQLHWLQRSWFRESRLWYFS